MLLMWIRNILCFLKHLPTLRFSKSSVNREVKALDSLKYHHLCQSLFVCVSFHILWAKLFWSVLAFSQGLSFKELRVAVDTVYSHPQGKQVASPFSPLSTPSKYNHLTFEWERKCFGARAGSYGNVLGCALWHGKQYSPQLPLACWCCSQTYSHVQSVLSSLLPKPCQ